MKSLPEKTLPEIADPILKRIGFSIDQIREHKRNAPNWQEISWCVAMISIAATKEGWGYKAIGRFVNRGHDVIIYHCKKVKT